MGERLFEDATVGAVMIHGMWFDVEPGSYRVYEGGDFARAEWSNLVGRYSAFLRHVEMVRHEKELT